jgi:hypothetical protein
MGQRKNIFFADINVHGPAIEIARAKYGLTIVRAIDVMPGTTLDPVLFAYAGENDYVMLTGNFRDFPQIGKQWIAEGKTHSGLLIINKKHIKNPDLIADWLAIYEDEDLTNREEWI